MNSFEKKKNLKTAMMSTEKYNILIGCTGSVASIKLPLLVNQLQDLKIDGLGTEVRIVATKHSFHFFSIEKLGFATVFSDDDEWAMWKQISDPVLHVELRKWADILLIAPLDANTLAKIANGICDNLLTCTVRAWDKEKPLIFCPAMNTYMWEHPITGKQIELLKELGYIEIPCVAKKLACGDTGYGGMAEVSTIVNQVSTVLKDYSATKKSTRSLKDKKLKSTC